MARIRIGAAALWLAGFAGALALGGLAFIYSGLYPVAADVPHTALTTWALDTLREHSVARASADVDVPSDLESARRLLSGGPDYHEMCSGCHLRPGKSKSDFTLGLYPSPPDLTRPPGEGVDKVDLDRRRFWIIKHGIKASGMPAWGPGHDDERIWNMVSFLGRLPEMSPEQYQVLTARRDGEAGHH